MKNQAPKRLFTVAPYRPGKPIGEVKRELGLKRVIKMASNENPYGPSPKVLEAMQKEISQVNRYPDSGCFYLRQKLAKCLGVKEGQLIFGNGSDEIIILAVRAFVQPGDEVVVAQPSFLIYDIASRLAGASIKAVPLSNFCYDLEKMLKAVTAKTKIIFIGNPDNPAGTFISDAQLRDFLSKVGKEVLVFVDEAYFEYVTDRNYPDSIKLLKEHKNLIVTRTFSKMYGLAGLRIGYGISSLEIIDILGRLREPFNVNSVAQAAALACLKDQRYYRDVARQIEAQREYLYRSLARMGLSFIKTATNFILIEVGKRRAAVLSGLLEQGIIVRDMSHWGLNSYIRVTIGSEAENKHFIKALKIVKSE